jgi:hypothetical protein
MVIMGTRPHNADLMLLLGVLRARYRRPKPVSLTSLFTKNVCFIVLYLSKFGPV